MLSSVQYHYQEFLNPERLRVDPELRKRILHKAINDEVYATALLHGFNVTRYFLPTELDQLLSAIANFKNYLLASMVMGSSKLKSRVQHLGQLLDYMAILDARERHDVVAERIIGLCRHAIIRLMQQYQVSGQQQTAHKVEQCAKLLQTISSCKTQGELKRWTTAALPKGLDLEIQSLFHRCRHFVLVNTNVVTDS